MAFHVDFKILKGPAAIGQMLGCSADIVQRVADGEETHFVQHEIPKRNPARGNRVVWAITNDALRDAYGNLADRFDDYARKVRSPFPHPAAHGYVRGRSIYTNAKIHVGSKRLLKADIASFFNTITTARVQRLFLEFGMQRDAADLLARFATHRGVLPLGFPSSPVLANAVCLGLDDELQQLAQTHGCKYTRYADDLTFSNKQTDLPSRIDVESALQHHDFTLSPDKFYEKKRGHSFYVTGLSVSENDEPRAPAQMKKRLRQELYFIKKHGLRAHIGERGYASYQSGINQIDGRLRFLHSIEPDLAREMRETWQEALASAKVAVVHQARRDHAPREVFLYFDESVIEHGDKKILLLGCALTEDADVIRPLLTQFLDSELADPYSAGKKGPLARQGLHWKELHPDSRTKLTELIGTLPIRAYVAYGELTNDADYKHMYLELLSRIVQRRLIALDGRVAHFIFEENPKVRINDIDETIRRMDRAQESKHGRRPSNLVISKQGKLAEPCLALADALLALLGHYGIAEKDVSQEAFRFERVRGKFRVIDSADEGRVFTRRDRFARGQLEMLAKL